MAQHLRPALVMIALFTLLTGLAYPLAITAVSQVVFPAAANGSLIVKDGKVIGSTLIGQAFTTRRLLPAAPVRHHRRRSAGCVQDGRCTLQRCIVGRFQPGADHAEAARPRQSRRRKSARRRRQRSDSGRCGHRLGERPRPACLAGDGITAGVARGQGAWSSGGPRARARGSHHRGPIARHPGRTAR